MTTTTISDNQATFDSNAVLEEIDSLLDEVEISAERNQGLLQNLRADSSQAAFVNSSQPWSLIMSLCGLVGLCIGLGLAKFVL